VPRPRYGIAGEHACDQTEGDSFTDRDFAPLSVLRHLDLLVENRIEA